MSAGKPRYIGVLLAAGRSSRMGHTKQLASWHSAEGEKPLVAAAYDAIRPICDEMIVVLGHDAAAVAAALGDRPFRQVCNDAQAPMFESIRVGIRAAQATDPNAHIVLQPGDHPEVSPATLDALTDRSLQRPVQAIIPEYGGRGGHPALIPPEIAALLLKADCPTGLGDFWLAHPELCHRVPVEDPNVLRDVDTPNDLPA